MKKMESRQTKMSGRVRRANCGRSANSSERLGDRLVRRRAGMRLITPYNLPLNNCLICPKPLDPVKPYQAIRILMRGPYQIWAGAFFFTSSSLASTLATSPTLKTKPDPRDWRSHGRRNFMAFRWIAVATVGGWVFFSAGRPLGQLRALLGDEEPDYETKPTQRVAEKLGRPRFANSFSEAGTGKSSSSLARAKEMDRLGGLYDVCHVRQEVAQRAVCTAIFREKMLKFTDSRTTSVRRARSCHWRDFWG